MSEPTVFNGKLVMVGFGSIGQAVLPLLFKHLTLTPDRVKILTADPSGYEVAFTLNVTPIIQPLTTENYEEILTNTLNPGDFLLNLSVNVSSICLIELCQHLGVLYLDTCIEPWEGAYHDPKLSVVQRSNYMLREEMLKTKLKFPLGTTAVVAHGANPGMVSHFVKKALLILARDTGMNVSTPSSQEQWADLSYKLGVKSIHIAERDTQDTLVIKKPREFVNTWSIDGFISEGFQPSEIGWGTHEKRIPSDASTHTTGCKAAIYLNRPGFCTKVCTWTPLAGNFHGYVVTHNESISIADFLTIKDVGRVLYRPTVHYAYHPCNDALLSITELVGGNMNDPISKRLLKDEITHGVDELGVLLMGHSRGAFWFGSQLSIEEARATVPYNNATSLQVAAGVIAGIVMAVRHPQLGVVEAEELDFEEVMEIANPYLGAVVGEYSDWNPLRGRNILFTEDVDHSDPWQFQNFRVS